MGKRPFERRHGQVIDSWEGPDGKPVRSHIAGCFVGEKPSADARQELLEDLGSGSPTEYQSIYALSCDRSKEKLEGLLKSLRLGNISAPMALTRFLEDPRVQPALLEAARNAPGEDLANFAQVVGIVAGVGSREVLRDRLKELMSDPRTFQPHDFHNSFAGSLETLCRALLRLESDADDAADALIALLDHPCAFNRELAVGAIADVLAREPSHQVCQRLTKSLERFLDGDEPERFLSASRALVWTNTKKVIARLRRLVSHESEWVRTRTVSVLCNLPSVVAPRCLAILIDRLELEPSLRLSVTIARHLDGLAPAHRVREVVERALNDELPSLRMDAIGLLSVLESGDARAAAERALSDEPDPLLRKRLLKYVR